MSNQKKQGKQNTDALEEKKTAALAEETAKQKTTDEAIDPAKIVDEAPEEIAEPVEPMKDVFDDEDKAARKLKNKKKLKYGSLATAVTVIFIAVVVLLNVLVSALAERVPMKLDLTSTKMYEISDVTKDYISNLDTDIQIIVLADESYFQTNSTMKIVAEILQKYKATSNGRIDVEYVDMTKNPEKVSQYGECSEGDFVVSAGDDFKVIAFDDIIATEQTMNYETYSYDYSYSFVGEQTLTAAIMNVTDANPKRVAMVATVNGQTVYYTYTQYAYAQLNDLLEKNGYEITEIDLYTDELNPADYDMVVLMAPYEDLTDSMISKLDAFLYNDGLQGKDLLYFADVYQSETPNIDAFLELWGVSVGQSYVCEGDSSLSQYVTLALGSYSAASAVIAEDVYSANLSTTKLPIVAPLARPITLLFDSNSDRTTTALLQSTATSYLYPLTMTAGESTEESTEETSFDVSTAESGAQTIMSISTKTISGGSEVYTSDVMVVGSTWMMDYYVAQSTAYNNAEYMMSAINVMEEKEASIVVAEKAIEQVSITITDSQLTGLRNVVVGLIPIVIVIIGVVVFVRRRNR